MLKRKSFWIALLFVVVIGGGGYAYYATQGVAADDQAAEPDVQTAVVRQGDIVVSATGAGTVIPATEMTLSFASSGKLAELMVAVGDRVQTGDLLARLDETAAQKALLNAQLQYAQTAMQTDATATQSGVSYDEINLIQVEMSLAQAQENLDTLLNWTPDTAEIAELEARLASAEASYAAAQGQSSANSTNIALKNISVDQALRDLAAAQALYDVAYDPGREWELNDPRTASKLESERARADDTLLRAQESLRIAQLNYSATAASTNNSSVVSAESNLLSAQLALAAAQTGPTADEIAAAETAVRQAELSWQQTMLNQEANRLKLAQAELALAEAEEAVANTILTAPIDGTVMTIAAQVGEQVGTAALITLADLSRPMLEIFLDETDLDKVGVGFEVDVVFDALPDDTFSGQIVQVDPELYQASGVTAVRALVQINYNKPQILPVGLNATIEVIGGRAENALLVPVEALREITPGQYSLFVMENGEPRLRMVEVGLMDFTSAEILSGVEAGEEVTTGILQTQ